MNFPQKYFYWMKKLGRVQGRVSLVSSMYMVRLTKNRAKGGQRGAKKGPRGGKNIFAFIKDDKNALKC